MALSQRMQNLSRNPQMQRSSLQDMTKRMISKSGAVSKSTLKKVMGKHFHGSRGVSRRQAEKALKDISQNMEEQGVKGTYYGKKVRKSIRGEGRFAKGGVAEKEFHKDIKRQYSAGSQQGGYESLDMGTKRKLLHKVMDNPKRLSKEDRALLGEEGVKILKERAERMKQMNQYRRKLEREEADKAEQSGEKKPQSSGSSKEETKSSGSQQEAPMGSPAQKAGGVVPLQGGVSFERGMAGQFEGGGFEQVPSPDMTSEGIPGEGFDQFQSEPGGQNGESADELRESIDKILHQKETPSEVPMVSSQTGSDAEADSDSGPGEPDDPLGDMDSDDD